MALLITPIRTVVVGKASDLNRTTLTFEYVSFLSTRSSNDVMCDKMGSSIHVVAPRALLNCHTSIRTYVRGDMASFQRDVQRSIWILRLRRIVINRVSQSVCFRWASVLFVWNCPLFATVTDNYCLTRFNYVHSVANASIHDLM